MTTSEATRQRSPCVWFITGCSTGLGRALAEAALAQGNRVIATARDITRLQDLAQRYPDQVRLLRLDVTVPSEVQSAVAAALALFRQFDRIQGKLIAMQQELATWKQTTVSTGFAADAGNLISSSLQKAR